MHGPYKRDGGLARVLAATANSIAGLRDATAETAFRQELAACAVLVPVALWLPVTPVERVLLIGSLALVLVVELLNSALESAVDRVSYDRHELSRRAKDLGSAAVMVSLALAALTWHVLAAGPLWRALSGG